MLKIVKSKHNDDNIILNSKISEIMKSKGGAGGGGSISKFYFYFRSKN